MTNSPPPKRHNCLLLILTLTTLTFQPIQAQSLTQQWKELFTGRDLFGWDTYLGPREPGARNPTDTIAFGLNHDPDHVFSVVIEDGQPAIRISGENHGGLSTMEEFENYHLYAEFKWGKSKIASFANRKRDSGILYHAVGPHGADYGNWMRSQEFQIQEGDCGDYWGVAGGMFDIPAVKNSAGLYVYTPAAPLLTFSASSPAGRRCAKNPNAEKPTGEWNKVELYCFGDTSVHIVNGKITMILYHSRQSADGKELPLKRGKIQIQSEGCEIYYRHLRMHTIDKLPTQIILQN